MCEEVCRGGRLRVFASVNLWVRVALRLPTSLRLGARADGLLSDPKTIQTPSYVSAELLPLRFSLFARGPLHSQLRRGLLLSNEADSALLFNSLSPFCPSFSPTSQKKNMFINFVPLPSLLPSETLLLQKRHFCISLPVFILHFAKWNFVQSQIQKKKKSLVLACMLCVMV